MAHPIARLRAALLACVLPLAGCTTLSDWTGFGDGEGHHGHGDHADHDVKPIALYPDLGTHTHPITASPEAQKFFDQGVLLTFNFHHAEAIRSFERAAEIDPSCAMCWWGVALSHGPNINMPMAPEANAPALAAVAKAQALGAQATPRERAYIDAVATRYSSDPKADRAALDAAYARAMQALAAADPSDLDAQTFYAEALMDTSPWDYWAANGRDPKPGLAPLIPTLERVIAAKPDHIGALHLYIHATEASADPKRAEDEADRLAALAPLAGHLVHMPTHTYSRIGRYADSVSLNQRAAQADERYFELTGVRKMYAGMYYVHNLHFVWSAAAMDGQSAVASDYGARVAAATDPDLARTAPMIEPFVGIPMLTAVRFRRWDDALAQPAPLADLPLATALHHYGRARAFAAKGDLAQARSAHAETTARCKPELFAMHDQYRVPGLTMAKIAERIAAGDIAAAEGRAEAAIAAYREAVALEDTLPYMEPPYWDYPTRHTLGAALLAAGDAKGAEEVFRADLKNWPDNGWALHGLMRAQEAQGQARAAARTKAAFARAWARADVSPDFLGN